MTDNCNLHSSTRYAPRAATVIYSAETIGNFRVPVFECGFDFGEIGGVRFSRIARIGGVVRERRKIEISELWRCDKKTRGLEFACGGEN